MCVWFVVLVLVLVGEKFRGLALKKVLGLAFVAFGVVTRLQVGSCYLQQTSEVFNWHDIDLGHQKSSEAIHETERERNII